MTIDRKPSGTAWHDRKCIPGAAKAVIGDIRRRDVVAAPLQHGRDCAGAAARFPNLAPELNMPKKRLSDPVRSCVEVADFAIVAGDVDRAGDAGPRRPGSATASVPAASPRAKRSRTPREPVLLLQHLHPMLLVVEYGSRKRISSMHPDMG